MGQIKEKDYDVMGSITESSRGIDFEKLSFEVKLKSINKRDHEISEVVKKLEPEFLRFFEDKNISDRLETGGRIFSIGAGTSGRISVFVESDFPTSSFKGIIAGSDSALVQAKEGAEDDFYLSWEELLKAGFDENKDILIGVAASGRTPYVLGALKKAQEKNIPTGCVVCNNNAPAIEFSDFSFVAEVGPESVRGSTRMGAGTAQMLILTELARISQNPKNINAQDLGKSFEKVPDFISQHLDTLSLLGEKIIKTIQDEINSETLETEKEGGNLFYLGEGTLGRIAFLDAVEIPPTFGQDYKKVQGILAGGKDELGNFKGLRENISEASFSGIDDLKKAGFNPEKDFLIGIGNSEYVQKTLKKVKKSSQNIFQITLNNPENNNSNIGNLNLEVPDSQKEVSLKILLQMLSTSMMAEMGFVAGDEMINIKTSNEKLRERGFEILKRQKFPNITREEAFEIFDEIHGGRLFEAIKIYKKRLQVQDVLKKQTKEVSGKIKKLCLAGDGGGTSLDLGLFEKDEFGGFKKLAKIKIKEPFSASTVSEEDLKSTLQEGITKLKENYDFELEDIDLVGFGVAGAEVGKNREKVNLILEKIFSQARINTSSDAKTALIGSIGNNKNSGIQLIGGTGSVSILKEKDAFMFFGGKGPLKGDEGSAFDIGKKILKRFFKLLKSNVKNPEKIIQDEFFHKILKENSEFFKIDDKGLDLLIVANISHARKIFGNITRIVLKELEKENPNQEAVNIINEAILDLTDLVIRAQNYSQKNKSEIPVYLHGGLFNSEYFRVRVTNLINKTKGLEVLSPKFSALEGALIHAEKKVKILKPEKV